MRTNRCIPIRTISFYYNRFSAEVSRSRGRFRNQSLLSDNTWCNRYSILQNDRYSISSTQWTLVSLIFEIEKYLIKTDFFKIDTTLADMCFTIITITHSVYKMDHVQFFKDLFELVPDYRKIALLWFLFKKVVEFLDACEFLKNDNDILCR